MCRWFKKDKAVVKRVFSEVFPSFDWIQLRIEYFVDTLSTCDIAVKWKENILFYWLKRRTNNRRRYLRWPIEKAKEIIYFSSTSIEDQKWNVSCVIWVSDHYPEICKVEIHQVTHRWLIQLNKFISHHCHCWKCWNMVEQVCRWKSWGRELFFLLKIYPLFRLV